MLVMLESPVMDISPVNVTPALVIVQSFVHANVPLVSGDHAAQLHSTAEHVDELGGNDDSSIPAAHAHNTP